MITFVPRDTSSKNWFIIGPFLSMFFTIIFGLLIFTFLGYSPLETLYQIFISPFSRIDRISDIFVKACPLIIIGTGLMLCFRANVWNIGAEGQFIIGALLAGSIALLFPNIDTKFFMLVIIFIGFIGGAFWAFIPAILKTKLNNIWLFKCDNELIVEDSILVDKNYTKPIKQIVIKGIVNNNKTIKEWSLEKI